VRSLARAQDDVVLLRPLEIDNGKSGPAPVDPIVTLRIAGDLPMRIRHLAAVPVKLGATVVHTVQIAILKETYTVCLH